METGLFWIYMGIWFCLLVMPDDSNEWMNTIRYLDKNREEVKERFRNERTNIGYCSCS